MSAKIKLQVNHGKHKKAVKESGGKLTIKQQQKKQQTKIDLNQMKNNSIISQGKSNANNKQKNLKEKKQNIKKTKIIAQNKDPKQKAQKQKQKQPDKQLQTIQRIKNQEEKTKRTIQQLIIQYKDAADDIFTNHGHNSEKERKINNQLQRLQKQHNDRLTKIKNLQQKSLAKSQAKIEKRDQKLNNLQQKEKNNRKKKAEQKLSQLKALSQQRLQKQANYQQYYVNEYKKKVPRFKKYQEQLSRKREQFELQDKEIIDRRKQRYKPMNHEQINDFEDNYHENKWSILEENEKRREQQNEIIQTQNMNLKAKLWRGQCHKRVRQEQMQQERIKNSPKTKLEKTKQYGTIIKSDFRPKINSSSRNMSLSISKALHEETESSEGDEAHGNSLIKHRYKNIARQKYFQGKNTGLVIEKLRKPLEHSDKVIQGNSYLQYVINLPKNRADGSQSARLQEVKPEPEKLKVPSTTFKAKRTKNPYYSNSYTDKISRKDDMDKIKNPQSLNFLLADMRGQQKQLQLEQKAIAYGHYNGVLQLQNRHSKLNKKIVQSINDKLQILSQI